MALIMGIFLPGLFFSVAERMIPSKIPAPTDETTLQTQETVPQQTIQPPERITVPVLHDGAVRIMDLDTYLIGVVLGEMPADFEEQALRAQAVVARTYALKRCTTGNKHEKNAVCTESACCQAYLSPADYLSQGGSQTAVDKVTSAVTHTSAQVLMYNGALIEATYFSCSGGRTEDAAAVWGNDIPYLQAVDSPGEEGATHYEDTVRLTASEFASRLGISLKGAPSSWFGPVTYTEGGGVNTMKIAGKTFQGTDLRQKLGLRSTVFTVATEGDVVVISTKGFGHRVGMSQYGAEAMAVGGSTYREILAHYYPGTSITIYSPN